MVQINTLLDLHPAGLVQDIKNAFNTVSRLTMLEKCRTRLPKLFPLARACYANASTLFYRDDDGYHDFASAAGSQQGDPFGGVLFTLACLAPSSTGSKPPSLTSTSSASGRHLARWACRPRRPRRPLAGTV